jgi:hypothetical protein
MLSELAGALFWFALPSLLAALTAINWTKVDPIIPYGKVSVPDEAAFPIAGLLLIALCLWFD